ncbi:amino acid adenylation domain-containing protein [Streptosporangium sp. G11]|uniref:non-ribosomal peptide synthetase/MFS transporter n=1 Tax=Streptosporangium sp. G11 TaxID=3436926 RepID=UPI003EBDAA21
MLSPVRDNAVPAVSPAPRSLPAGARGARWILEAVEAKARQAPDAPAVLDASGVLSYADLVDRAGALARGLRRSAGVGEGDLVGLLLPRGADAIVAMLGILGAGAGYVPLDPAYPADRLALMAEEAGLRATVTTTALRTVLPPAANLLFLDSFLAADARDGDDEGPGNSPWSRDDRPGDAAYVIFTSGSTGRPKGVAVSGRALAHFCGAAVETYGLTGVDRVLQFASLSFDASVEEIFPALTRGATVVVRDDDMISRPDLLLERCHELGVTVLDLPTAYWHELVEALSDPDLRWPPALRLVIIGGERARPEVVRAWRRGPGAGARLLNTYGPTEATVVATVADLGDWDGEGPVPIGFPIPGVRCLVAGADGGPVPPGAEGELHIGGPTVALGYLGRPEATAERFYSGQVPGPEGPVPGPESPAPGREGPVSDPEGPVSDREGSVSDPGSPVPGREGLVSDRRSPAPGFAGPASDVPAGQRTAWYRTGDRVRQGADGSLVFLGRDDHQVKIRGFRVELGEIESTLCGLPGVRDAVVGLDERVPGAPRLAAHLLVETVDPSAEAPSVEVPSAALLRRELGRSLPAHMVPASFTFHPSFPITVQGKVDRAALVGTAATGDTSGGRATGEDIARGRAATVGNAENAENVGGTGNTGNTGNTADRGFADAVTAIWAEVLGRHDIGDDQDFFSLGGDSLAAVRVLTRLRGAHRAELTLADFYAAPTVSGLAGAVLRESHAAGAGHFANEDHSPADDGGQVAPTPLQADFWMAEQLYGENPVHNLGIRYRLDGPLDTVALREALDALAARHAILRSRYPAGEDGRPVTVVDPPGPVRLDEADAPDEHDAEAIRRRAVAEPFDLARGPLLRAVLLRMAGDHHELLLIVHHTAFDGWSAGVVLTDLAELYRAARAGVPARLPAPGTDFSRLAAVRAARAARPSLAAYWRHRLAGADLEVELPADRPRPAARTYRTERVARPLPDGLLERLETVGRDHGASLFMVLLAGVRTLMWRVTGREDVTVLAPVACRGSLDEETAVGPLLNILPLRGDVLAGGTFAELLAAVRRDTVSDLDHQELPLPALPALLGLSPALDRNPFGPVMLTVHNTPSGGVEEAGVRWRYAGDTAPMAGMVDLSIGLDFPAGGPVLSADFATELFEPATVDRLLDQLLTLLDAAAGSADRSVGELPLLSDAERHRILHTWNDVRVERPTDLPVHRLFEAHASATPEAPALTHDGTTVTYGELNARANRLARALKERGAGPGALVAICLDRGVELFTAMWAVLKSGAAYVPLDPAYPAERLRYMLRDSGAAVLVTRTGLAPSPSAGPRETGEPGSPGVAGDGAWPRVLALDTDGAAISRLPDTDLDPSCGPDDPAYVIYTSGSTGRAKGVVVTHRHLVHAVHMWQHDYRLSPDWTYQQAASFSFDMFVGETLRALCTGGRLVVVPREALLEPAALLDLMRREGVRCTELVPAVLRGLLSHAEATGATLDFVRLLIGGGEKWHVREYRQARRLVGPGGRVVNAYGVTEVTVDNVYFDGDTDGMPAEAPLPIGRPFANNRAYVLDAGRSPVPPGVVGELYLGGDGVAAGYHGRPELTAERFLADPFVPGARMYRTGDGARYRADGTVEFLGRLDDQVKVNGYRIELGEVEAALGARPDVLACAAAVHDISGGTAQLVGYVTTRPGGVTDEADLRRELADVLPAHMVPARIVSLASLPLTPNGKLDRRALPAPPEGADASRHVRPATPTEIRIAEVWSEVLQVERVGGHDTFFALGGDSFSALRLVRRIDPALRVIDLYQNPTVARLAALLDARAEGTGPADGDRLLRRLSGDLARSGSPAFTVVCVPYSGGQAVSYHPVAEALPDDCVLYAVELPGHDIGRPEEPLLPCEELAALVVAEMREIPGPVVLYGHCMGTALTVEVARQAEQAGVRLLGTVLGASFPTARLPGRFFDWVYRVLPVDRLTSDREYLSFLRARGGFTELQDPAEQAFALRNVRHDARDAEEYFTAAFTGTGYRRLRSPILSLVGERDRVTELHQERHQEWAHFSESVEHAVIPGGGHFFIKHQAPEVAEVIDTAARRWRETEAEPVPSAPAREDPDEAGSAADGTRRGAGDAGRGAGGAPPGTAGTGRGAAAAPSLGIFALVALGQFVSLVGSGLSTLVLSIWVYQRTGDVTAFGVMSAVGLLPGILAGPIAGAVADRWDRRRVMLAADSASGVATAVLAVLLFSGRLEMWQVYAALALTSLAGAFQRPAYLAAVAQIVPKRYLGHANGIAQLGTGAGAVFAPMLGAGLIGVIGVRGVLLVDAATFLVGAGTLLAVRFPDRMFRRREESFGTEIANGWRYVARRPGLRIALRFFVIDHLFYTLGFAVITPMILIEQSEQALGLVLSAGGVGGLLGALTMSLWGGTRRRTEGMIFFMGVASVAMAFVGLGTATWFAVVGMFVLSFTESLINGHWIALLQTKVGLELQGRVLSIFITVMMLTMPLGFLVVGPLADHVFRPLLEPGGALADSVGPLLGTGPGRGLALLIVVSGLVQLAWAVRGWLHRRLRFLEDELPDALPPARIGDRDTMQRHADELLATTRS